MSKRKRDVFPKEVTVAYDGEGDDRVRLVGDTAEEHADSNNWKDVGVYRLVRHVKVKLEAVTRVRK